MDKIVVITGGTSGICLELKKLYEKDNDTVLTISTRQLDDDKHYSVDVSDEIAIKNAIDDIGTKYGRIDVLINGAGFGMSGVTELLNNDDVKKLTEVNYYGTIYAVQSAIKYMQKGAKIVNVSSAMALFPVPFRAIYGSVKSAVLTFSFALRMELEHLGIIVTAVCPGDIKTNFTKNRIKNFETNERYGNKISSATIKSDSREDKRISAEKCALVTYKKISKKKIKPFFIVGKKFQFLYFLTRITPKGLLLKFTNKFYGGTF